MPLPLAAVILAGVFTIAGCGPPIPTAASPSPPPPAAIRARPRHRQPPRRPRRMRGPSRSTRRCSTSCPTRWGARRSNLDDATAVELAGQRRPRRRYRSDRGRALHPAWIVHGRRPGDRERRPTSTGRLRRRVVPVVARAPTTTGACEVAGGVAPGAAVTEIGGHETHIGSCQGGVHTYHVHLANPDRIVSITAAGEGRFGERVVEGLTE